MRSDGVVFFHFAKAPSAAVIAMSMSAWFESGDVA